MKKIITTGWSFMRVFRIVAGLAAIIYAIIKHDFLSGAAGLFLLLTGLFNVGVCGSGECTLPNQRSIK